MGPSSVTCSRPVCSTVRNHPRVARRASTRTNTPRSEPIVGSSHDRSSLRWRREREGASGAGAVRADRTGRLHRRLGAGHGPPTRVLGGPRAHQRSRGPRRRQPSGHDRGVPRPRHGHGGVRCRPGGATGGQGIGQGVGQGICRPRPRADRGIGRGDGRGGAVPARPDVQPPRTRPGSGPVGDQRRPRRRVGRRGAHLVGGIVRLGGPAPARTGPRGSRAPHDGGGRHRVGVARVVRTRRDAAGQRTGATRRRHDPAAADGAAGDPSAADRRR